MADELRRVKGWDGDVPWSYDGIKLAVLVEIRDELRKLNSTMACRNTQMIPGYLKRIASNTAKPKKAKA